MLRQWSLVGLLCALACRADCSPYANDPETMKYGDGYATKSSASLTSSSYASANRGNVAIDGIDSNGKSFVGTRSVAYSKNGATRSEVYSSSVTGSLPLGLASTGDAVATYGGYDANVRDGGNRFWWMGANSPFRNGIQQNAGLGCTSNGCLASTVYRGSVDKANAERLASSNPFLRGSGFTAATQGGADAFLANSASVNAIAGVREAPNPFFAPVAGHSTLRESSNSVNAPSDYAQTSQGFENAFAGQRTVSDGYGQIEQNLEDQRTGGFPAFPTVGTSGAKDAPLFGVTCSGETRACVPYYLCSAKGFVKDEGLARARSQAHVCDLNNEVCCNLPPSSKTENSGGIFGKVDAQRTTDLTSGQDVNSGGFTDQTLEKAKNNGYLPPIGGSPSSNVPAFTNPPHEEQEPDRSGGSNSPVPSSIFPPPAVPAPQVGCAAALLCVEDQYCSLQGVITTEPVALSPEQLVHGVPRSTCKNPDTGIIGKCCRDPNYVDPWPAGNLPANYSGGFDEQGFPTIFNIAKTRPTKKQPVKGKASGATGRPIAPQAVPHPSIKNFAPYEGAVKSPSPFAPLPEAQVPYYRNNYDTSPSNQNPTVVASLPGGHCGRRNAIKRPEGTNDVDVAFGEITWQAMVLSNTERKLLCSGAIVAPNAVVTAASCVHGLRADQVSIKSGEWKLGYELKHEEPLPFEIVKVASIVPYPSFSPGNPAHDIALLLLEHDLKLDSHVDTLCLPEDGHRAPRPNAKCIATGWGKTVLQVNVAGALMHGIEVDLLNDEQCLQRISAAETQIPLDDTLFCAKAHRRNNNMCQVDFGGPLACERPDGFYELAGIYNQDTGCLPTNQVATFAEIPTRWIQETMTNPPRTDYENESRSPVSAAPGHPVNPPKEPCNCQERELLPAGSSQYLPPV